MVGPVSGIGPTAVSIPFSPSERGLAAPTFSGQVVDVSGIGVGGAEVVVFDNNTNLPVGVTTSNSDGSFACPVPDRIRMYYAVAYLAGSPDRAGTTDQNLTVT